MNWLDNILFGAARLIFSRGTAVTSREKLNFAAPLVATDNSSAQRTDVTVDLSGADIMSGPGASVAGEVPTYSDTTGDVLARGPLKHVDLGAGASQIIPRTAGALVAVAGADATTGDGGSAYMTGGASDGATGATGGDIYLDPGPVTASGDAGNVYVNRRSHPATGWGAEGVLYMENARAAPSSGGATGPTAGAYVWPDRSTLKILGADGVVTLGAAGPTGPTGPTGPAPAGAANSIVTVDGAGAAQVGGGTLTSAGTVSLGADGTDEPAVILSTTQAGYHWAWRTANRVDGGIKDFVAFFGVGILASGGPEYVDGSSNAVLPGVGWGCESRFNTGSGYNQSEWYPIHIAIGTQAQKRPFYLTQRHDTFRSNMAFDDCYITGSTNNVPFLGQSNAAVNNTIELIRANASDQVEIDHDAHGTAVQGDLTVATTKTVTAYTYVSTQAGMAATPNHVYHSVNTTAATGGAPVQVGGAHSSKGAAWDTAASKTIEAWWYTLPQSAATPFAVVNWQQSIDGAAATDMVTFHGAAGAVTGACYVGGLNCMRAESGYAMIGYGNSNNWLLGTASAIKPAGGAAAVDYTYSSGPITTCANGPMRVTSQVAPSALASGRTDNYNPTSFSASRVVYLTANAAGSQLSGIVATADGDEKTLYPDATGVLTLNNEDANSTAANRFLCPGAAAWVCLAPDVVRIRYRAGSVNRWLVG